MVPGPRPFGAGSEEGGIIGGCADGSQTSRRPVGVSVRHAVRTLRWYGAGVWPSIAGSHRPAVADPPWMKPPLPSWPGLSRLGPTIRSGSILAVDPEDLGRGFQLLQQRRRHAGDRQVPNRTAVSTRTGQQDAAEPSRCAASKAAPSPFDVKTLLNRDLKGAETTAPGRCGLV